MKNTQPTISRESVYRGLNEFAEFGLIQRLDYIKSARYDCQTEPHDHFICETCGAIINFFSPADAVLPVSAEGDAKHIELRISGIFRRCK